MSDTTYNGWKNYPTWAVNLWLSNDEDTYNAAREIVAEIIGETKSRSKYWTLAESHKFSSVDALKEWVTDDLMPELNGFPSDLLGYALDCVDWYEIAEYWINDLGDAA